MISIALLQLNRHRIEISRDYWRSLANQPFGSRGALPHGPTLENSQPFPYLILVLIIAKKVRLAAFSLFRLDCW